MFLRFSRNNRFILTSVLCLCILNNNQSTKIKCLMRLLDFTDCPRFKFTSSICMKVSDFLIMLSIKSEYVVTNEKCQNGPLISCKVVVINIVSIKPNNDNVCTLVESFYLYLFASQCGVDRISKSNFP